MRHALTMGAAALAAVPAVILPLPASAAHSSLETWAHDYYTIITSPGFADITDPAFGAFDYLDAVVLAALYGGWKDGNPADMATLAVFNGFYAVGGEVYSGALFGRSHTTTTSGTYKLFQGETYDITIAPRGGTLTLAGIYYNNSFVNWSSTSGYTANGITSGNERGGYIYYTYGTIPEVDLSSPFNYIWTRGGGTNDILGKTRGANRWYQDFPSGVITSDADALEYIKPIVDDTVENYPELAPYVPDVDAPTPTYPVQDTWAADAEWPEGNLLPTIPAASYSVDIPEIMTEGASFWWRCLGVLFDGLGITAVVIGLLALGIVLYFVLR